MDLGKSLKLSLRSIVVKWCGWFGGGGGGGGLLDGFVVGVVCNGLMD